MDSCRWSASWPFRPTSIHMRCHRSTRPSTPVTTHPPGLSAHSSALPVDTLTSLSAAHHNRATTHLVSSLTKKPPGASGNATPVQSGLHCRREGLHWGPFGPCSQDLHVRVGVEEADLV